MPVYQVEDARGRVLELEGDHEPTPGELESIFKEAFPAQEAAAPAPVAAPSTTPAPDPYNAIGRGYEHLIKSVEPGSFNAAFEPPDALKPALAYTPLKFEPGSVGGEIISEVKKAESAIFSPGGAVLGVAGAAAPIVAGPLGALISVPIAVEGTKQLLNAQTAGEAAGGATRALIGAAGVVGGALSVKPTVLDAIRTKAPASAEAAAGAIKLAEETKPAPVPEKPATVPPDLQAEASADLAAAVGEDTAAPLKETAAPTEPAPAAQPLGITPPAAQVIDALLPHDPATPPPIVLKPGERLPQPRPFAEAKRIFAQPFGMGKLPVIGIIADANARIRTPVQESINTYYANTFGIRPAISAAFGEEVMGTLDAPFKVDPKTSKILNITAREGQSTHVGDVMEALQRDPNAYDLTPEQRAAFDSITQIQKEVETLQKKEGVFGRLDEDVTDPNIIDVEPGETGKAYFPRTVIKRPKKSKGPVGPRAGSVGAKQFFQRSRMFNSEAEGVSKGYVYEPSIEKRLTTLVDRTYKAIFDKQLAEDPALGGRTHAQLKQEVQTALADKLASGELTQERIDAIVASKAAKGRVWEPGLMKYIFEPEVAEVLNRKLPKTTGELGQLYSTVNNAARELKLSGDFSAPMIQLLPTLYRNPVIWGRAVGNAFKAVVEPSTFDAYVKRNLEPVRELAQLGTSVGQVENLLSGQVGRSTIDRIPGIRKAFAPFQRHFQTALDVAKIELWKAWREVTPPEQRLEVARTIESQLGISRVESAGIKHAQAYAERALLLANSYYRGSLNYIALLGQKGVSGKIARQGLGALLAGGTATYVGIGMALGMTEEKIMERLNPASGNFMMWPVKIGDRVTEVGLGGFYRSMLRLAGNLERTAIEHPERFLSLDPNKNPFTKWWRGHASLPVGVAWNQFSGEDYLGRDTTIADIVPSLAAPLATESGREYIGSKVSDVYSKAVEKLPSGLQAVLPNKLVSTPTDTTLSQVAVDTLASFMGASAYQESRRNQLTRTMDERAQTSYGKPYGELPIAQQRAVAEQVQQLAVFRNKPEPTKREREMAFQADIDRVIRIRSSLPSQLVTQLDDAGVKLRGFDPALEIKGVRVPLTRRQSEAYEKDIQAQYARMIPLVMPALQKAESPAIRQKILDRALEQARAVAKAQLISRNTNK